MKRRPPRLGPGELAFFLEGETVERARQCFGRGAFWWSTAIAQAEADGLLVSPGRGPEWYCTPWGATQALTWMLQGRAVA